jgi:putative ABC transport system permease protein
MILHLLKMVWNRKRTNLIIVLEIFASFLLLFSVAAWGISLFSSYSMPRGFSCQNVWVISVNPNTYNYGVSTLPDTALQGKYKQLLLTIRSFEQVEAFAAAGCVPYQVGYWIRSYEQGSRRFDFDYNEVSDTFKDVLNLQMVRGRWFEPADDALNWQPVVVNEQFARMAFGNEDPLGKIVPGVIIELDPKTAKNPYLEFDGRIVGVIGGYRRNGEFSAPKPYVFSRRSLSQPASDMLGQIVIKIKPGTPRSFEEQLMRQLNLVAGEWSFQIQSLDEMRVATRKVTMVPIQIAAIVAGFLMIMVGFGLMGVLWLNVTQRVKEIGLRRAQGATASDIYVQILGELFFIASMGLVPGVLLVIQFPLLNLIANLKTSIYFYSIAFSVVLIYALTFICGLYPGWLAIRIRPADALRYE